MSGFSNILPDSVQEFSSMFDEINSAKQTIFQNYPELDSLSAKISKRPINDYRVPPGSLNLELNHHEPRYRLCDFSLRIGIWFFTRGKFAESIKYFHEAYLWYPKSCVAIYYRAESLRIYATTEEELRDYETLLRKAIGMYGNNIQQDCDGLLDQMKDFREKCAKKLILYLLQSSRSNEADITLRSAGFHWRISEKVLNYSKFWSVAKKSDGPFVMAVDNVLHNDEYMHLCETFHENGKFWEEHEYDPSGNFSKKVGYFSYLYPMRTRNAICSIEQIIDKVFNLIRVNYPIVEEAQVAEWWVHSRPHSNGHQMHFDSDETRLGTGGTPKHPIVSCVIYLSDSGGPTIVTDQTLASGLASKGWLIPPMKNRLACFDASYLHGVIPGIGPDLNQMTRRLTFMIGFWRSIEAKTKGRDEHGAGQPFPDLDSKYLWHRNLQCREIWSNRNPATSNLNMECIGYVDEIWKELDENQALKNYKDFFQGF